MKSMTGFGRASSRQSSQAPAACPGADIEVSIRAVNGRYLDSRVHLPREYSSLEGEIKTLLAVKFSRGTIDLYVNRGRSWGFSEIVIDTELARNWLQGFQNLGVVLGLKSEPTLELIARQPDIFKLAERTEASEAEKGLLKDLVRRASEACEQERVREGQSLQVELEGLCAQLETLADEMLNLRQEANTELEKRLRDRLQKLGFSGVVDDQRIAQEVVMQVDRSDISEELTRLREHVRAYRELLRSAEPEGKKLDFYAQELLREVNTVGSKSQIARLTSLVVVAKTVIEKIREQVQNVE